MGGVGARYWLSLYVSISRARRIASTSTFAASGEKGRGGVHPVTFPPIVWGFLIIFSVERVLVDCFWLLCIALSSLCRELYILGENWWGGYIPSAVRAVIECSRMACSQLGVSVRRALFRNTSAGRVLSIYWV